MPGFVVNGNQYTSGRNVIMGKETPTSWVRAIQHIEDLGKENDNFVFKNAELREEIEAWRKEIVKVRQEMKRRKTVYDEVRKEYTLIDLFPFMVICVPPRLAHVCLRPPIIIFPTHACSENCTPISSSPLMCSRSR